MPPEFGDLNPNRSIVSNLSDTAVDGGLFAQAFLFEASPMAGGDDLPRLDRQQQGVVDGFDGLPVNQAATRLRQFLQMRVAANAGTPADEVVQKELDQLNPHLAKSRGQYYFHVGVVKGQVTIADVQDRVRIQLKK